MGEADLLVGRPEPLTHASPRAGGTRADPQREEGTLSDQSTGAAPCCSSMALTRLNGREPKNPRAADNGLGW